MPPWAKSKDGFFYATIEKPNGARYNLTVEKMDGEGETWEWLVWLAGQPDLWSRHGYGRSTLDAMAAAERALNSPVKSTTKPHTGRTPPKGPRTGFAWVN